MSWQQIYSSTQTFHNIKVCTNGNDVRKYVEFDMQNLKKHFDKLGYVEYLYVNDIVNRTKLATSIFGQNYSQTVLTNLCSSCKQLTVFQQRYIKCHKDVPTYTLTSFMENYGFVIPDKEKYMHYIKHLHIADDYSTCYNDRDFIMFVNYEKQLLVYDLPFENTTFADDNSVFIYDLELYNLKELECKI